MTKYQHQSSLLQDFFAFGKFRINIHSRHQSFEAEGWLGGEICRRRKLKTNHVLLFGLIGLIGLHACKNEAKAPEVSTFTEMTSVFKPDQSPAPSPEKKPFEINDDSRVKRMDPYYWLNQRDNPAVKAYLEAENKYFEAVMAPVAGLKKALYDEMVARVKQDDNSVPYQKNGYWYYTRYATGKEYPIYCRKKGSLEGQEEILVDANQVAEGHEYSNVIGLNVSPDNKTLFYAVDYTGRSLYKSVLKDLETGKVYPETFDCAFGASAWANDNKTILYDAKDHVTLRTNKVFRHVLGTNPKQDVLMYEEKDETAYCYLEKSKSEQFFFINSGYSEIIEVHYLDANQPSGKFQRIKPRSKEFVYQADHIGDKFLIRTNWDAPNFRLMEAPVANPGQANWKDLLPHDPKEMLESIEIFQDYLVAAKRGGGLKKIQIMPWNDLSKGHFLDIGEPTYEVYLMDNPQFATTNLRYGFSSQRTPTTTVDYDMASRIKTVRKEEPVLGGFDTRNYETELLWADARDGAKVPISLVYKKGLRRDGSAPCYLQGYGSYGFSYDPSFESHLVSLLDRGFVCGIAHIRGGKEMGAQWYQDGKMLNKKNSFYDFIDCGKYLCTKRYTREDRLFAGGRSAGGLLMGAVANMAPGLFKGIIAGVPFVDVLTTMGDSSIPLTTGEYTEWGNPAVQAEYEYMASYSPYDQVKAQAYPNLFVSTSFEDSQVQYFEPAKWVPKIRDLKTNKNMAILKTNMSGSHGGSSGRFKQLSERAEEYAWMLGLIGRK